MTHDRGNPNTSVPGESAAGPPCYPFVLSHVPSHTRTPGRAPSIDDAARIAVRQAVVSGLLCLLGGVVALILLDAYLRLVGM